MKKNNKNNPTSWRNEKKDIFAILGDNKRLLMPAMLVVAVAITVIIALSANHRATEMSQTPSDADAAATFEIPEVALEENAYPDVNALVDTYYVAMANGDSETLSKIYKGLDETEILKAVATAEYIEDYENITVYTKPGPVSGSYIAYVYNEVKLYDYPKPVPGLETLYICTNDEGLYIDVDFADENVLEYIKTISVQDDVIDLNNRVATSYNEMVNGDEELAALLTKMRTGLQVSVGEALASSEASSAEEIAADAATTEATVEPEEEKITIHTIRATDVVNIRSSDSETADILDKTERGQEFKQLEALANGWSKIEYKGGVAYVKTEFFEVVGEETVDADTTTDSDKDKTTDKTTDKTDDKTTTDKDTSASATKDTKAKTGKMEVNDSVRLRKEQSTDSDIIAMIYSGTTVNVVEQYSNGWAKVEYNGSTGYIKSEFLGD